MDRRGKHPREHPVSFLFRREEHAVTCNVTRNLALSTVQYSTAAVHYARDIIVMFFGHHSTMRTRRSQIRGRMTEPR